MVNLYKLLNTLEKGMTLYQLDKWKTQGIWNPLLQYKKESNEIQVVTNLFIPHLKEYHIQLTGNYDESEKDDWEHFLDENQHKIYPLLKNLLMVFLPDPIKKSEYQVLYTVYPQGIISVIIKNLKPYDNI